MKSVAADVRRLTFLPKALLNKPRYLVCRELIESSRSFDKQTARQTEQVESSRQKRGKNGRPGRIRTDDILCVRQAL